MIGRRWKVSQTISLSFVGLILAAAVLGVVQVEDKLISDTPIAPSIALKSVS